MVCSRSLFCRVTMRAVLCVMSYRSELRRPMKVLCLRHRPDFKRKKNVHYCCDLVAGRACCRRGVLLLISSTSVVCTYIERRFCLDLASKSSEGGLKWQQMRPDSVCLTHVLVGCLSGSDSSLSRGQRLGVLGRRGSGERCCL